MTKGEIDRIHRLIAKDPEGLKKEIERRKAADDAEGLRVIAAELQAHADALERYLKATPGN